MSQVLVIVATMDGRPYLPSCWNDEAKMTAYFSPLRTTTANPEGVVSKINFWKSRIHSFCNTTKKCCFTIGDIVEAFTRNNRAPQCISTVIEEMAK